VTDRSTVTVTHPGVEPASRRPHGPRRYSPLAVWAALGAAAAFVLTFDPTDQVADPTGPCLWHSATGIAGPTCGGTRMFYHLLHGDLVQAARHHLVALVGMLYGGYALTVWTAGWVFGKRLPLWRPSRRVWIGYVVVFVLYATVLRNLPWAPFDWFYVPNLT
jgi:hypothetical protein